tara:strand:- start:182619 stop:183275 length:657 start_codon:yes stop_codon:yes gene_type:complete
MKHNIERAKELLPSIILTILSMIQALALELYWSRIEDSGFLWEGGAEAVIGWLQLAVMLLGMLLIWVFYVSFVLRFTWLPSVQDTLIPFLIGLLEFALIDLMGPAMLWLWFLLLAVVMSVATYGSHLTMRQARQDPDNDYFFRNVEPATWRDYLATTVMVVCFCLFGLVLWLLGNPVTLSVLALVLAVVALGYRVAQVRLYWMHSMVSSADSSDETGD